MTLTPSAPPMSQEAMGYFYAGQQAGREEMYATMDAKAVGIRREGYNDGFAAANQRWMIAAGVLVAIGAVAAAYAYRAEIAELFQAPRKMKILPIEESIVVKDPFAGFKVPEAKGPAWIQQRSEVISQANLDQAIERMAKNLVPKEFPKMDADQWAEKLIELMKNRLAGGGYPHKEFTDNIFWKMQHWGMGAKGRFGESGVEGVRYLAHRLAKLV